MIYPKIRCPICRRTMVNSHNRSSIKPILQKRWKFPRISFAYYCAKCGTSLRISIRVLNENPEWFINRITNLWWWEK